MNSSPEGIFTHFCKDAETNPAIVGLFLGGSRGKGLATPFSDYDVYVIVQDGAETRVEAAIRGAGSPYAEFFKHNDLIIRSVAGLKVYPPWATGDGFEAYDFKYITAIIDKQGVIQPILEEKATRHVSVADLNAKLDAYINFYYRSLKCLRDGHLLGARLEANTSIALLLDFLFALHSRATPYGKYLEWELGKAPLAQVPISSNELLAHIKQVWDNASVLSQRYLFLLAEKISRAANLGSQIDSWGRETLQFMREWSPVA